jgi:peptidyl-prolyl cis-trans isomerase D
MTMLDRMRRHRGWLKWSLGLVVLAFVLLYIPDFLDTNPNVGAAPFDVLASVEGREITAGEFRRVYLQQISAYRRAYGSNMNDKLLRQLGIDQRILQQMIDQQASLAEARRLGIKATDGELRARIMSLPNFKDEKGQFIGDDRYRQLLRVQTPPRRPDEFEADLRDDLVVTKLRAALTEWMTVADAEVDEEFRRRNEKVKLELVTLTADKFREGIAITDAEASAHFDKNKEQYRVGEKRKVRYMLIDAQALRARVTVTPQEIQDAYRDSAQQYSTPEQIKASHILLKTEGKKEEDVKKQAEGLLAKIKAGADFASLAQQYSEDDSNKAKGGDLGMFGRGSMVPEFEQAAFALEPGQTSDVVKTNYGFHIIRLVEKQAAATKPIDEVRTQIEDQIKWERAQEQATRIAEEIAPDIDDPTDLDRVAKSRGFVVSESGFFDRTEPIAGLGFAPEASADAFAMKQNETRGPIQTPSGFAFIALVGTQAPHLPKFEDVKQKVTDDLTRRKAVEAARQKAASLATSLRGGDFAKVAETAGFEVKTTELVARGSALPDAGQSDAVDAAVFKLPAGAVSEPIEAEGAVVIARVVERKDVTPSEVEAGRAALRQEVLDERRGRFFAAYMTKAKQRMNIRVNQDTLRRVIA